MTMDSNLIYILIIIGLVLVAGGLIVTIDAGRRRQERDVRALRETLAELAREENMSDAEAAMRKMRGQ